MHRLLDVWVAEIGDAPGAVDLRLEPIDSPHQGLAGARSLAPKRWQPAGGCREKTPLPTTSTAARSTLPSTATRPDPAILARRESACTADIDTTPEPSTSIATSAAAGAATSMLPAPEMASRSCSSLAAPRTFSTPLPDVFAAFNIGIETR